VLGAFSFADLLCGEPTSAGAAPPIIGGAAGLTLRTPCLHQLASAIGTLSFCHSVSLTALGKSGCTSLES